MKTAGMWRWSGLLVLLVFLAGCAKTYVQYSEYDFPVHSEGHDNFATAPRAQPPARKAATTDRGWTERVLTERDLARISAADPELSPSVVKQILSKLNARAPYYIDDDIKAGRPIKVPNNFAAFKEWSPLEHYLPELKDIPQFILIAKDVYYLGWYQYGKMVGDTYICVGKEDDWTRAGLYSVREKDAEHISRSYKNAFGVPAPMPNALRVYEHVWVHTGDIEHGNCSHGCINLPLMPSQALFNWAKIGTPVLIVNSRNDIRPILAQERSRRMLFAEDPHRDNER